LLESKGSLVRQEPWRIIEAPIVVGGVVLGVGLLMFSASLLFNKPIWEVIRVLAAPVTVGAAVPLFTWLQKRRELDVGDQRARKTRLCRRTSPRLHS
jgi:hypothetical protein